MGNDERKFPDQYMIHQPEAKERFLAQGYEEVNQSEYVRALTLLAKNSKFSRRIIGGFVLNEKYAYRSHSDSYTILMLPREIAAKIKILNGPYANVMIKVWDVEKAEENS